MVVTIKIERMIIMGVSCVKQFVYNIVACIKLPSVQV